MGHKAEKWRRVRMALSKSAFDRAVGTDSKISIGVTEPDAGRRRGVAWKPLELARHRAAPHTAVAKGAL